MSAGAPEAAPAGTSARTVAVWQDQVRLRVLSRGRGPALVYFHGPFGLTWDPFLDALARDFTVLAPEHPGTTPGAPDDIYRLDNLWDLVLCYDELLDRLGLERATLVGHSFGAMVACELAAACPRRAERLALIAPIGFWRDTDPVVNWMTLEPDALRARLFREPAGEAAARLFGPGEPADAATAARVRLTWAMGATGKFIWPLPDKGLKKRIHRVSAPALVLWGSDDRLVPPVYAGEFTRRLAGARAEIVKDCGHAPQLEQPDLVAGMIRTFAAGARPA
ncbi:MAG TPA: alpha/beta fold hydrolase [Methylomirabilota bacterium]|nr:alpha/beta fold hydrolase [Methylomirabilota bacterium]